ncbi:MAG TPA: hypothetical protein VMB49_08460 [Acidobacteriaceae bacterium]|nr:hypothetical protein [Acidobacteriaceae bacterium]
MLNRKRKTRTLCCSLPMLALALQAAPQRVLTSQYDNARTGANLNETRLTPQNVNVQRFGKLFTFRVDGDVYAQPLFLGGVDIPGKGRHDVLFIATEHDSVYAFDAYGNPSTPLWQVSLLKDGFTPVPAGDAECPFIAPEIGITSTPVIDPNTGTLYVLARTKDRAILFNGIYAQRLHALAVTTGVEKFGGPTEIQASMAGKGTGSSGGTLKFNPLRDNPRAALLLNRGTVYLTWASACDVGPYHGWIMAYDAHSLKQKAVFNASPDGDDSGIWGGDTGPAADQAGNVFVATGNGRFDAEKGGRDYGDTLLKLDGTSLKLSDYFAPFNVDELDSSDSDLGSGGPMLLPDQAGPIRHLAVVEGKGGVLYLIDRDHMGRWQPGNNSHAVQTIAVPNGVFGAMTYWNHNLYVLSDSDSLRQFEVQDAKLSPKAASPNKFPGISATPVVSANGSKDGVVWLIRSKVWDAPSARAALFAYDAANVANQLYNSEQNAARDRAGMALRFNIPMVVNGHVYVGASKEVDVYGLLPASGGNR